MPRRILTGLLFLIIFCHLIFSQSTFSINGYYKNYFTAIDLPKYKSASSPLIINQPPLGWVNNRLRLNIFYRIESNLSFTLAYDFSPRIQDPLLFESQPIILPVDPSSYRFADFNRRLYPSEGEEVSSFGIFQNLDRAYFSLRLKAADLFIGRQAIAWGSARVINPTDVIAPFAFYELDTEDRIGVDAIRIRVPMGFMGEFDTGYIFGKDLHFNQSALYIRSKVYLSQSDLSVLLLGFRNNLLLGIDIARAIGGAGFWLETAYVFLKAFKNYDEGKKDNYLRLSTGIDYSLGEKTYVFLELHFNSAGSTNPEDYLSNFVKPAYTEGTVYLTGKYYMAPGIMYQITPLIILNGIAFFNFTDPSLYLAPAIEYNLSENIYISGGIYLGIGKNPQFSGSFNDFSNINYRSEFGAYPNIYFTSFRIYF